MPETSRRVASFTESVIRHMTRLANAHGAINLSQGFPDFDPPEVLKQAAEYSGRHGPHQYAVTWGAPNFRQALARKQSRFTGLAIDPDAHIVVTCGSTEAMMAAMMTACNPGDRVIVFSPFYENYVADTILSGAQPIYVPLHPPDFRFDEAELRAAFAERPKAMILCNPANPSGRVFSKSELELIAQLATQADAFVITDEVYEHIVFAPHQHTYFATLPGVFDRTITCGSLSKTYSVTGWRLGYVIAAPAVIAGARKVHDFLTVGAAAPLQEAAVAGLNLPDSYYAELQAELQCEARAVPGVSPTDRIGFFRTGGRILRSGGHCGVGMDRRPGLLRLAGQGGGCGRGSWLQFLSRAGAQLDSIPLCQAARNPGGGRAAAHRPARASGERAPERV
jgi:aspartate/methionine/tyrosine aminotransferase